MKKIKIIEYTERWSAGGIEMYINNIVKYIDKSQFDITIMTSQKETDLYDNELSQYCNSMIITLNKIYESPIKRTLKNFVAFYETIKKSDCDILHLHICHGVALFYAFLAKKAGVLHVVVHSHNSDFGERNRVMKRIGHEMSKRLFTKYMDERIACSDKAATWLYTKRILASSKVQIVKYGIDSNRFKFNNDVRNDKRQNIVFKDKFILLNIGRFNYQKNQLFLIRIFNEVVKKDKNSLLILIGSGELQQNLVEEVRKLKLIDKVLFIGNTHKIEDYLWLSDVFLLPSLYEGNPISGIEAQASGINCFFSDTITKEAGILPTTIFIPLSFKASIWADLIMENKEKVTYREACNEHIKEVGFDIHRNVKEIEKIYTQVFEKTGSNNA